MDATENNPAANALPNEVTETHLDDAIGKSGFPLQLRVAAKLRAKFAEWDSPAMVEEEWSYVDRDEGKLRPADIHARVFPKLEGDRHKLRVRPDLVMIFECRQSRLPYIFFDAPNPKLSLEFPQIAGLPSNVIVVRTNGTRSSWSTDVRLSLGLFELPFVSSAPAYCHTFDRIARKGSGLELSGVGFNDLIPPVLKAMAHYASVSAPRPTFVYFDCHALLGVCVIDAPMILAQQDDAGVKQVLTPWIRVVRQEALREGGHPLHFSALYGVDVIHHAFLDAYLTQWVRPFLAEFAARAARHHKELASSRGFARDMEKDSLRIEARLRPRA